MRAWIYKENGQWSTINCQLSTFRLGFGVYKAKITVTLRKSILDPQGKAVLHGAHSLGYDGISDIRIGKFIEMNVEAASETEARKITDETCRKLLANPVMEDFQYTMEKSS